MLRSIIVLAAVSVASVASQVAAEEWRAATQEEAQKMYSNRTMEATVRQSGSTFKTYFNANGTWDQNCCDPMWNWWNNGTWSVENNRFCSTTNTGPRAGVTSCVNIITNGKEFTTERGRAGDGSLTNVKFSDGKFF